MLQLRRCCLNKTPIDAKHINLIHARYTIWLCTCYGLFIFRVMAQLTQKFYNLPFLPPFEAWYSGALAYNWLLISQIIIIAIMGWVIMCFIKSSILPRYRLGVCLLTFGGIYFLAMLFRLIAGFTFAVNHSWLGAHIPAFFHIVLASFVLLIGHFNYKYANKKVPNER